MTVNELLNLMEKGEHCRFCFTSGGNTLSEVYSADEACRLYGDENVASYKPNHFIFEKDYFGLIIDLEGK